MENPSYLLSAKLPNDTLRRVGLCAYLLRHEHLNEGCSMNGRSVTVLNCSTTCPIGVWDIIQTIPCICLQVSFLHLFSENITFFLQEPHFGGAFMVDETASNVRRLFCARSKKKKGLRPPCYSIALSIAESTHALNGIPAFSAACL